MKRYLEIALIVLAITACDITLDRCLLPDASCAPTGECEGRDDGETCATGVCASEICCETCLDLDGECVAETNDVSCGSRGSTCQPCRDATPVCRAGACGPDRAFVQAAAGRTGTCARDSDGRLVCFGRNDPSPPPGSVGCRDCPRGGLCSSSPPCNCAAVSPSVLDDADTFIDVSSGRTSHELSCAVSDLGALFCWGPGGENRLGLGPTDIDDRCAPTEVVDAIAAPWERVVAAGNHACGLRGGGQLFCWGNSSNGQIGLAPGMSAPIPVRVHDTLTFGRIDMGGGHGCGITPDGVLYCWGANFDGQLGTGARDSFTADAQVVGPDYDEVATGGAHTCAIRASGTLYCWGDNRFGQLGAGSIEMGPATPTQVGTDSDWEIVRAGQNHTCAIKRNGELYCWGENAADQLGRGGDATAPAIVAPELRFVHVSPGLSHTCAIAIGGLLYCWGNNGQGQLGPAPLPSDRPQVVPSPP